VLSARPLVAWQLADGKRGHERQVEGLLAALADRVPLATHLVGITRGRAALLGDWLAGRFGAGRGLPAPDLLVGAGSRCELALLAARRACGGRAVCLMRPSLPLACFDLCIVPRHDGVGARGNVIESEGTLSPMRPAAARTDDLGVILLGGPSAHHDWNDAAIVAQVLTIVGAAPHLRWEIGDSRRTPPTLMPALQQALAARSLANVVTVPFAACAADWLPATLARAQVAWVTADSVAMLYEALSAGARLGVIDVPAKRDDRITAIAPALIAQGRAAAVGGAPPAAVTLTEAARCAEALLARWPDLAPRARPA